MTLRTTFLSALIVTNFGFFLKILVTSALYFTPSFQAFLATHGVSDFRAIKVFHLHWITHYFVDSCRLPKPF